MKIAICRRSLELISKLESDSLSFQNNFKDDLNQGTTDRLFTLGRVENICFCDSRKFWATVFSDKLFLCCRENSWAEKNGVLSLKPFCFFASISRLIWRHRNRWKSFCVRQKRFFQFVAFRRIIRFVVFPRNTEKAGNESEAIFFESSRFVRVKSWLRPTVAKFFVSFFVAFEVGPLGFDNMERYSSRIR